MGTSNLSVKLNLNELPDSEGVEMESAFIQRQHSATDSAVPAAVRLPDIKQCRESVPLKWALRMDVMLACQQGICTMAEMTEEEMASVPVERSVAQSDFTHTVVRQIRRADRDNVKFTFQDTAPKCFYAIRQSMGMSTQTYQSIFNYERMSCSTERVHTHTHLFCIPQHNSNRRRRQHDGKILRRRQFGLLLLLHGRQGVHRQDDHGKRSRPSQIPPERLLHPPRMQKKNTQHNNTHPQPRPPPPQMTHRDSLVVRFYGLHAIKMHRGADLIYFVVMDNVFLTRRPIDEVYDLKGSWIDRGPVKGRVYPPPPATAAARPGAGAAPSEAGDDESDDQMDSPRTRSRTAGFFVSVMRKGKKGQKGQKQETKHVLKDMDISGVKTVVVAQDVRTRLVEMARRDCEFFARNNIMDYSLLLGVHKGRYADVGVRRAELAVDLAAPADSISSPLHRRISRMGPPASAAGYKPPTPDCVSSGQPPQHRAAEGGGFAAALQRNGSAGPPPPTPAVPVYRRDEGGLFCAARSEAEHQGDNMYFMGVIDILQQWTLQKRLERWCKVLFLRKDPRGLSAVEPHWYAERFMERFEEVVTAPRGAAGLTGGSGGSGHVLLRSPTVPPGADEAATPVGQIVHNRAGAAAGVPPLAILPDVDAEHTRRVSLLGSNASSSHLA